MPESASRSQKNDLVTTQDAQTAVSGVRDHAQTLSKPASLSSAPALPSLLLGLRHTGSSRSVPTVSHLAAGSTGNAEASIDGLRSTPVRRRTSTLNRSVSTASLAPPTLSLVISAADSSHADTEVEVESDDESDASSGFEGLLERVGVTKRESTPRRHVRSKTSPRGNEEAQGAIIDPAVLRVTPGSPLEDEDGGDTIGEEDDTDYVDRSDGQSDPREILRAQLHGSVNFSNFTGRSSSRYWEQSTSLQIQDDLRSNSTYVPRRYYILSSAGKLIYTTEQDEEEATGHVGVMQAIISIFADERDKLRYVDAGKNRIAFLLKAPLYLACSSTWGEPQAVLRSHLEYLYLQVLSIITQTQLSSIFNKRSNFDLRRLMEGTEGFFTALVMRLQTSLAILTNSIEVYRISAGLRNEVSRCLTLPKMKTTASSLSLLYALIVSHGRLVTLVRPSAHSIHPTDLQLLLNTISSSASFRETDADSWIPICLPRFNNKGFLYAYISFVTGATGVVMISAERDAFEGIKAYAEQVKASLRTNDLLHRIDIEKSKQLYSLGELAIAGLRHFLYKSRGHVQITHPAFEGDYEELHNRYRLITLYQRVYTAIHMKGTAIDGREGVPPAKLVFVRTEHEAVLGWTTPKFELYLAVSPLMPKTAVVSAARAVSRWIQHDELFLTSAPTFRAY